MIGSTASTRLLLLAACAWCGAAVAGESTPEPSPDATDLPECGADFRVPADAWLDRLSTGWRPLVHARPGAQGDVDEVANARVIFETFVRAGRSPALAYAAIVTALSESSLDQAAIMDDPFVYLGKPYPNGSGALGLFQLLPSEYGAGGPSGVAQGYPRDFLGMRWVGTPEQAARWGDEPDELGRRYYDGTDPRLNTERILLEIERDGAALVAADARGASIADLTYLFGRDIERPQGSTEYRRKLAVDVLGPELALAKHPNDLFEPVVQPWDPFEQVASLQTEIGLPPPPVPEAAPPPPPQPAPAVWGAFTIGFLSLVGLLRPL